MKARHVFAVFVAAAYITVIVLANWAINHFGVVHVGLGYKAPAGVWFVGAALVLRDLVQVLTGFRRGSVKLLVLMSVLIGTGALVSYEIAPAKIATASAVAFLASELLDYALFTLVAPWWGSAVLVGGIAAAIADSAIFLSMAYGSLTFLTGQVLGKSYGIVAAAAVIGAYRRFLVAPPKPALTAA